MTLPATSTCVVYAQILVREGHRERFLAHILQLAERSLTDEAGCLQYDVIELDSKPRLFGIYEVYRTPAAYAVHQASPHFHAWKVVAEALIDEDGLDVRTGRRVPSAAC